MIQRIAAIGDVHGCYEEFEQLIHALSWLSLDEIWHVGDLVDRGPHSGKTIDVALKYDIKGVMGNHDDSIINHFDRVSRGCSQPRNPDKRKTLQEITDHHVSYLRNLPFLHVIDPLNLVLVHGGIFPSIPLYAQSVNVCRAQMVHPFLPGKTKWWGEDAKMFEAFGETEEQLTKKGWNRWYRLYDHDQHVIFGHSTFAQPFIHQNPGYGMTIGVDTGSCFGGSVTACIFDGTTNPSFMSVKCKKIYYTDAYRSFMEG